MAGRVGRRIGGDKITKANTGLLRPENEGFIRMRILLFLKKKGGAIQAEARHLRTEYRQV